MGYYSMRVQREELLDKREKALAEAEEDLRKRIEAFELEKQAFLQGQAQNGITTTPTKEADADADEPPPPVETPPTTPAKETPLSPTPNGGIVYTSSKEAGMPVGGACYLVYEPDSSGRLVEYYSKTDPIEGAIGRWNAVGRKSIAGFKFKSAGNVVIAGCSGGVQGRKNYFSGWCQFVRSACHMNSELVMWDIPEGQKGLPVDVWVYTKDTRPGKQSVKLRPGVPIQTEGVLGIACLPQKTQFYDQAMTIDINKWLGEGSGLGGSIRV